MQLARRVTPLLLPLAGVLVACQAGVSMGPPVAGEDSAGSTTVGDAATSALVSRETFVSDVEASLVDECGACHANDPPAFLAGNDKYDAVMAWPGLVSPGAPSASSILTTGVHTGPALTSETVTQIFRWITGATANNAADAGPPIGVGEGLPGAPTAKFEATQEGNNRLRWRFDAGGSTAEGNIDEYLWRWGDGTTGTGDDVVHTFPSDDTYAVQLTVVDDMNRRTTTTQIIAVGRAGGDRVVGFTLVDENDDDVGPLQNGGEINLANTPEFTIRADTVPNEVGSVRFGLDGNADVRVENAEPYELPSDDVDLAPGTHRLSAQAYSEQNGNGTPGGSVTITLSVR